MSGSPAGAGGDGGGSADHGGGRPPSPRKLALWPTFANDPRQSRDVQAVLAGVSALSMGSTTLLLSERWNDLSGATGTPRSLAWTRLDAMVEPYRDRSAHVALCINLVDRQTPAWPLSSGLDGAAARSALRRTIDEVYARYAELLSHLCLGYELDRYLARASELEQTQLLGLLQDGIAYASGHQGRTTNTAVGVAVTLDSLIKGRSSKLDSLLLGDEVLGVYDALDLDGKLKPPQSIRNEVDAALATLGGARGVGLPLALFEVGYPSGADVGSSEQAQSAYYEALLGVLQSRPNQLEFVGVFGLADRAAADCALESLAFGELSMSPQAEARARVRCSMGLRAENEKLAWSTVAAAVSRYR